MFVDAEKRLIEELLVAKRYIMSQYGDPEATYRDNDIVASEGDDPFNIGPDTKEDKDLRAAKIFSLIPGEKHARLRAFCLRSIYGWALEHPKRTSVASSHSNKEDEPVTNPGPILRARQQLLLKRRPVPFFQTLFDEAERKARGPKLLANVHLFRMNSCLEALNILREAASTRG